MIESEGQKFNSMKNRTIPGMAVLCLLLTATFMSCKKETALSEPINTVVTSDVEDYPGQDNLNDFTDTATSDIIHPLSITSLTFGTRKNLFFNFTTEPTNALASFYGGSNTLWKFRGAWTSTEVQRSSNFARTGSYSARYQLNKTDGDVGGSKRSETSRSIYDEPVIKVERWYGASYFLPTEFVNDKAPEILTQWKTDNGSPALALWTINGTWRIVKFGDQTTTIGNYDKAKWTDFVFHIKWSKSTDGLIEVWKNGVKVHSQSGPTLYSGDTMLYMKSGIYKWPWKTGSYGSTTTQRVIYIDDVRIGSNLATYYDVAPGSY